MEPCAHPETFRNLEDLGTPEPYRPHWPFEGEYLNEAHRAFTTLPLRGVCIVADVQGSLRVEDALKLYELAYFCGGPILELGCNRGLSTSILARATRDAAKAGRDFGQGPAIAPTIDTVDLEQKYVDITRATLKKLGIDERVTVHQGEASAACRQLAAEGRLFDFVFVDHSHAMEPVREACRELVHLTRPGCFVVFHDYNDKRNRMGDLDHYGVFQGVQQGLDAQEFEFYGVCGCCGIYRRRSARSAEPIAAALGRGV